MTGAAPEGLLGGLHQGQTHAENGPEAGSDGPDPGLVDRIREAFEAARDGGDQGGGVMDHVRQPLAEGGGFDEVRLNESVGGLGDGGGGGGAHAEPLSATP